VVLPEECLRTLATTSPTLIEIRKRESGSRGVHGPAAARPFLTEKAIGAGKGKGFEPSRQSALIEPLESLSGYAVEQFQAKPFPCIARIITSSVNQGGKGHRGGKRLANSWNLNTERD
jgi:hypothetical protein